MEVHMTNQECPRCKATFSTNENWTKGTIATLMAAPAVPDMATQMRCPKCGYVFGESEVRYLRATAKTRTIAAILIVVVGLFLLAIYQLV
jgi:uncharacterized C2H2 Zn-finger protein